MGAVGVVLALGLVGIGCAGGDDAADDSAGADVGGSGEAVDAETDATTVGAAPGEDLGAQAPPEEAAERIVYTAEVRVRVDDPSAAADQAIDLVEEAGGSLASQTEVEGQDLVTIIVRVPVDGFRPALDALGELGTVLDRQVDAEDVTDQVVDLEGRLENARASADRLRELYATAQGVDQIVAIEQALTQREAEVESLAGQLQALEDRADRSTITVSFVDEGEPVADEEPEPDDDNAFVDGLQAGGTVLVALGTAVAAVAGFALPFLPFVAVPLLVLLLVVRIRRRRSRRREAATEPAASSEPPTADPETPHR